MQEYGSAVFLRCYTSKGSDYFLQHRRAPRYTAAEDWRLTTVNGQLVSRYPSPHRGEYRGLCPGFFSPFFFPPLGLRGGSCLSGGKLLLSNCWMEGGVKKRGSLLCWGYEFDCQHTGGWRELCSPINGHKWAVGFWSGKFLLCSQLKELDGL